MKQKPPRWVQITAAVLRRYLALDMAVYAGSATLFLLTASFPLLMWVLMLVNLVPGFSVEGVAELLADFLPQIPEIQTAILGLLQNLSGQSAQFVASLAVLTTIVSASGGMNALQIGLQRLTPGSHRTLLNRLLAIGYTFVFELLLLVMLALQGMHSLFTRFADTLPLFRHYTAIVAPLQRGHNGRVMAKKRQCIGKARKQGVHALQRQHDQKQQLKHEGVANRQQAVQKRPVRAGRQPLQADLQCVHTARRRDDGRQHSQRRHKLCRLAA